MKRGTILLVLALVLIVSALTILFCQNPLSEAERQRRAEDYALLAETLRKVGYTDTFPMRRNNTLEENLRSLWAGKRTFFDARIKAEC